MQKTKLGISVGLLGAAIYFMGLFSGYLVAVLLTGYVLLFEENKWLKKTAVKAVALMVCFSFILVCINLISNTLSSANYGAMMFGGTFHIVFLSNLASAAAGFVDILQKLIFIGLGIKSFSQGTIKVPRIDSLINKHME